MKKWIKHLVGKGLYRSGLYKKYWQNRAVVLLFHSVDTSPVDNPLAYDPESFEQICRFCKNYFFVTTFQDLINKIENKQDISRHLVISFDDGYKDNYAIAARILRQHQLPACFFITTDFIESEHCAWWDKELGIQSQWMTWDDARSLHQQGFEIGSHSHSHANFGEVSQDRADAELQTSFDKIHKELDFQPTIFAYPYGQEVNIDPRNHVLTKKRYANCITAIYGTVTHNTDKQYIPRVAISPWYQTSYQLGFELIKNRQ